MLKFNEEVKSIMINNLEKNNLNSKNINYWITNRYLTLILELDNMRENKIVEILKKSFSYTELKEYSQNYLDRSMEDGFGREELHRISQKTGLNTEERKNLYKERVKELVELVLKMIDGDVEAYKTFLIKYEEYAFSREEVHKGMQKFIPLGVLISLTRNQENPLNLKENEKIAFSRNVGYFNARELISDIRYEIGCILGIRKRRKDSSEIIDSCREILESSREVEENIGNIESLESVKLERDQYKSSLNLIQNSLNELSEKVREETESIANEKIRDFFVTLNSDKYSNFLDKIPLTESILKEIKSKNYDIPREVNRVLMFIKLVIKFIKDQGITPIEEQGKIFEATAEEISDMDYIGEEFVGNEKKILKIVAPGYKYKDIIISIPKVENINEEVNDNE